MSRLQWLGDGCSLTNREVRQIDRGDYAFQTAIAQRTAQVKTDLVLAGIIRRFARVLCGGCQCGWVCQC